MNRTDKIVSLEEDKRVKETRTQINDLRTKNTELRRKSKNKGIPSNIKMDMLMEIENNEIKIEELLKSIRQTSIVPITETSSVAEHVYESEGNFRTNSFRF